MNFTPMISNVLETLQSEIYICITILQNPAEALRSVLHYYTKQFVYDGYYAHINICCYYPDEIKCFPSDEKEGGVLFLGHHDRPVSNSKIFF